MARPLRPLVAGGTYHVTSRGNRGQAVFRDDEDRLRFLEELRVVVTKRRWACLAWCLLGNHYHLLVRTPEADLAPGMQAVNGRYAQAFNARHGMTGHVFQARYASRLVVREAHLLSTIRYVVRNPLGAGLGKELDDWPWSSHHAMLGAPGPADGLVAVQEVADLFAAFGGDGLRRYDAFVGDDPVDLPLAA